MPGLIQVQVYKGNRSHFLQRHEIHIRWLALALGLLPVTLLLCEWCAGELGINPLERLEKGTGRWAFNYLLFTLSITPARRLLAWLMVKVRAGYGKRLSDWNFLVRLRRQLGLYCFFYTILHVGIYAYLDTGMMLPNLLRDLGEKPYVLAGMFGFMLLIPLAATSNNSAKRRLGRDWRRLHRLTYLVAIAAACHFVWLSKPGLIAAPVYAGLIAVLLGYRLMTLLGIAFKPPRDDGMEVPPRTGNDQNAKNADCSAIEIESLSKGAARLADEFS